MTLIAGHTSVPLPPRATIVRAETTGAMRIAVLEAIRTADTLVMAAAVSDFRPRRTVDRKLARGEGLTLELEPTEDILAEAGRLAAEMTPRPVVVGFAAEAGSLERAPEKLARKGVDLLVANDVTEPRSGFGTDTNRVTILSARGERDELPLLSKREVADRLLDRVARSLDDRDAAPQTGPMSEITPA